MKTTEIKLKAIIKDSFNFIELTDFHNPMCAYNIVRTFWNNDETEKVKDDEYVTTGFLFKDQLDLLIAGKLGVVEKKSPIPMLVTDELIEFYSKNIQYETVNSGMLTETKALYLNNQESWNTFVENQDSYNLRFFCNASYLMYEEDGKTLAPVNAIFRNTSSDFWDINEDFIQAVKDAGGIFLDYTKLDNLAIEGEEIISCFDSEADSDFEAMLKLNSETLAIIQKELGDITPTTDTLWNIILKKDLFGLKKFWKPNL